MQGTIESVTMAPGNGWTRYDVRIDGGKYATFDAAVGAQAMSMQGQTVEFAHTEKPSKCGKYINKTLTALIGGTGAVQPSLAPVPPTGASQPATQPAKNVMEDNKDKRTAYMTACDLVGKDLRRFEDATGVAVPDLVAKAVEKLAKNLYCVLQDLGKAPIEVATEIFTATEDEQEPVI